MEPEARALEELKIIQAIINNLEQIRLKIMGWGVAATTAISVAYVSEKIAVTPNSYLILSLIIIGIFLWLDTIHRVAVNRAIKRSGVIESFLRGEVYDLIGINKSEVLPETGRLFVIVALNLEQKLHLRIFDSYGTPVVNGSEDEFKTKSAEFQNLRERVLGLFNKELTTENVRGILEIVASITGRTLNHAYDGPKISGSLSISSRLWDQLLALRNVRVCGPYIALSAAVVFIYVFYP